MVVHAFLKGWSNGWKLERWVYSDTFLSSRLSSFCVCPHESVEQRVLDPQLMNFEGIQLRPPATKAHTC